MAGQALLVADRPRAVIQAGQPPAEMAAWMLDIPDGSSANATAAEFAGAQGFPIGTVARVIDLSANPITLETFTLSASWAAS